MYKIYKYRIENCDKEIEKHLMRYATIRNEGVIEKGACAEKKTIKKAKYKNHPRFNVRDYLERIHGVDVLNIYGLSEIGGLELLAETGTDLSKWESDSYFVSWLNLCPNNKISAGKLISSSTDEKET